MHRSLIGLVRDTLVREYGSELWDALANAPTAKPEVVPSDALACWLGQMAVPALSDTYPTLFARHRDLGSFINGLGDEIPAADSPGALETVPLSFRSVTDPDGQILLRIQADCSICALVQGVIAGAAVHYGEAVTIREIKSRKRGDNACVLQIEVTGDARTPESGAGEYLAVGTA